RPERAGKLVVTVRLVRVALLLETTPERVVGVVVVRVQLEHRAELRRRLVVPADTEVRDSERLANRRLVGRATLRLLERNRRLCGAAVLQMRASLLEEVVDLMLAHVSVLTVPDGPHSPKSRFSVAPQVREVLDDEVGGMRQVARRADVDR